MMDQRNAKFSLLLNFVKAQVPGLDAASRCRCGPSMTALSLQRRTPVDECLLKKKKGNVVQNVLSFGQRMSL
jgi:hypothetical protein